MSQPKPDIALAAVPEKSSVAVVATTDLTSRELNEIVAAWNDRRANRLMPARGDLLPRALGRHLPNVSLLSVL